MVDRSEWAADDVSRLVVFKGDLAGGAGVNPGSNFRLERSNRPPPPPSPVPPVFEMPWALADAGHESGVDVVVLPDEFAESCPVGICSQQKTARSARNVDLGMCSIHIPWIIDESTPSDPLLDQLHLASGDGIAQQLVAKFEDKFVQEISGPQLGSRFQGFFQSVFGFVPSITIDPMAAHTSMAGHNSRFFTRFRVNHTEDEICIRSNWRMQFQIPNGVLNPTGRCGLRDTSVQFCGNFVAQNGLLRFHVTSTDAQIQKYAKVRFECNFWRGQIEGAIRSSLAAPLEDAIDRSFAEQLHVSELLTPAFTVSSCDPNGPEGVDCATTFAQVGGMCAQEGTETAPSCHWDMPVQRVEILPSRLEIVIAESESDAFFQLLSQQDLLIVAGFVAQPLCRRTDSGLNPSPMLETHGLLVLTNDAGGLSVVGQ